MIRKFARYKSLSRGDRRLALQFAIMVPCVELCLRLFGFNRVVGVLSRLFAAELAVAGDVLSIIDRHKFILRRVGANLPFSGRCLARSLTLWGLLKRQGIDTDLRFGQRNIEGRLDAHAWIEFLGQPVNASPTVHQRFIAFEEPIHLNNAFLD